MGQLFNITHEVGDLSEYDATQTDSGDLSVAPGAALAGTTQGMSVLIDGIGAIWGRMNVSLAGDDFRVRIYIDPNSLTMANLNQFRFLLLQPVAWPPLFEMALYFATATGYSFKPTGYTDGGLPKDQGAPYVLLTDAPHYVEAHVKRAVTNVSGDGYVDTWLDGVLQARIANIDNFDKFPAVARMDVGATSGVDVGTTGTFFLDEVVANNDGSEIGPVASPATVPPPLFRVGLTGNPVVDRAFGG
jgi:hypothetical protein